MTVVSPAPAAGQVVGIDKTWNGKGLRACRANSISNEEGTKPHGSVGENGNYGRRVVGGEAEAGWDQTLRAFEASVGVNT